MTAPLTGMARMKSCLSISQALFEFFCELLFNVTSAMFLRPLASINPCPCSLFNLAALLMRQSPLFALLKTTQTVNRPRRVCYTGGRNFIAINNLSGGRLQGASHLFGSPRVGNGAWRLAAGREDRVGFWAERQRVEQHLALNYILKLQSKAALLKSARPTRHYCTAGSQP